MKPGLLKTIRGQRKRFNLYHEHIADFYPQHTQQQNAVLAAVAQEALEHMLSACENCPQACLLDYQSRSTDFDLYKD